MVVRLTAQDIHNKDFKVAFRGYDVNEVNDFLDLVIKDYIEFERGQKDDDAEDKEDRLTEILHMLGGVSQEVQELRKENYALRQQLEQLPAILQRQPPQATAPPAPQAPPPPSYQPAPAYGPPQQQPVAQQQQPFPAYASPPAPYGAPEAPPAWEDRRNPQQRRRPLRQASSVAPPTPRGGQRRR